MAVVLVVKWVPAWLASTGGLNARERSEELGRVRVKIDEELVERARARSGAGGKPDADVIEVEEAVAGYLGIKALDESQAESGLTDDDANRLAYEELHAMRRQRDACG